ncbi:MAG: GNAT family N-acetyltransferase [Anaerolineae bacterium]|nr:GNAT family N-acetyltransferase [Anaerolineae bacterium]
MAFVQVDRLNDAQVEQLAELYQREWWSRDRTIEQTRKLLENTPLIVAFIDDVNGNLAGFLRVMTDYVVTATISDVIVAENYRGLGLGSKLIDTVLAHPALQDVNAFVLHCLEDMVPFYERWGFGISERTRRMRLLRKKAE